MEFLMPGHVETAFETFATVWLRTGEGPLLAVHDLVCLVLCRGVKALATAADGARIPVGSCLAGHVGLQAESVSEALATTLMGADQAFAGVRRWPMRAEPAQAGQSQALVGHGCSRGRPQGGQGPVLASCLTDSRDRGDRLAARSGAPWRRCLCGREWTAVSDRLDKGRGCRRQQPL